MSSPISSNLPANSTHINDVLRSVPYLAPGDSIQRFLDLLRYSPFNMLPVIDHGRLLGFAHLVDTLALLKEPSGQAREAAYQRDVMEITKAPGKIVLNTSSYADLEDACASARQEMLAVVDAERNFFGVVLCRDLVLPVDTAFRMPTIGGMATPFGVYLSDGKVQAGAGNMALVASGVVLGVFAVASTLTVQVILEGLSHLSSTDFTFLTPEYTPPAGNVRLGLLGLAAHITTTLVFLALVRFSRIAGYHAAEHQTVHAVERGEPLVPEVVARMPRPHPRCGTNIMAAAILFWNTVALARSLPGLDGDTATLAAFVVTAIYWRRFGTVLQAVFTTRAAKLSELECGISAAQDLAQRITHAPPSRAKFIRRVWCSGILQSLVGLLPTIVGLTLLLSNWIR